ncbi:DUF2798 domain-containing protein [Candidatus Deianiraea vastatrix]|uniref:DUF2798 domain-containing protein n=1 Tax=Candidatus Deianiraea vastatrix TaxID=2163644 RepID=A0A5B8XEM2_9RICK|nr:DUF2798 domain-containing protein [Candidatus Deianiraea vastatrix]QED23335.1 hypothetical protein Deia_00540 [Candidatus Deianiraea vastatrix]
MNLMKNPKVVFPFLMALSMGTIMSGVMTFINRGFVFPDFFFFWLRGFLTAFPTAFCVAFFLAPKVRLLTEKICKIN